MAASGAAAAAAAPAFALLSISRNSPAVTSSSAAARYSMFGGARWASNIRAASHAPIGLPMVLPIAMIGNRRLPASFE